MRNGKRFLHKGILMLALFGIWTYLVQAVDVQTAGETSTEVGFASLNIWFHQLTGVHMPLYTVTDWLGLVPVFVCLLFAGMGFIQLIRRRSLKKVDGDILLLGAYYVIVILAYLVFEENPINYRPILIGGAAEASYPSSTTLLVLSVMPTLVYQTDRRLKSVEIKRGIRVLTGLFSGFMVMGRAAAGVHWITDIAGSVLLSMGLFWGYRGSAELFCRKEK